MRKKERDTGVVGGELVPENFKRKYKRVRTKLRTNTYIYIYIYMYRERERERKRPGERRGECLRLFLARCLVLIEIHFERALSLLCGAREGGTFFLFYVLKIFGFEDLCFLPFSPLCLLNVFFFFFFNCYLFSFQGCFWHVTPISIDNNAYICKFGKIAKHWRGKK